MKFVQNNKILVDSNAETAEPSAEISAEKAQLPLASLRFPQRSLRLCVEIVFLFGSGFAGLGYILNFWQVHRILRCCYNLN